MLQWLIDICVERVLDEIGIPPCYIDRGDPAAFDFTKPDFTTDGAWHTLSLAPFVPLNATAVLFWLRVRSPVTGGFVVLRAPDQVNWINTSTTRIMIANVVQNPNPIVFPGNSQNISYWITNVAWSLIDLSVRGYWL